MPAKQTRLIRPPLEKGRGRYVVVLTQEPAPDRRWNAQVEEVPAALTWGKSIEQCERRIREALSLFVDDADTANLEIKAHPAPGTDRLVKRVRTARQHAEEAQARAQALARTAVRDLVRTMTVRDVAKLLGLSHQRVQQLARI